MIKNNKGMTLVEIMVVLLIAAIAMTITGGILVNSLGYFDTSTKTSLDKQTTDGILDYISGEIKYATDVTVTNKVKSKPDDRNDWHCIYIANHEDKSDINAIKTTNEKVLYRDGSEVFSVDYYSKRNVDIQIKGFTLGEHRLDTKIILNDKSDKEVYKTTNTYELINLNMNLDNETTTNFFKNVSTDYMSLTYDGNDNNSNNKVLWYIKDATYQSSDDGGNTDPVDPTPTITGGNMVGSQVECINPLNNRGEMTQNNIQYQKGSFVYYHGYWWQKMYDNAYDNYWPGEQTRRRWKKIDSNFDYSSYYEKGDIVLYNNKKYICIDNFLDGSYFEYGGKYYGLGEEVPKHEPKTPWKKWFKIYVDGDEKIYGKHDCSSLWQNNCDTVASKLNRVDIDSIPEYKSTGFYKNGVSIVKIKYQNASDTSKYYYQYFLKLFDGNGLKPGTSAASGWQILDRGYHENSAYEKGDVVYYGKNNYEYVKTNQDIKSNISLENRIYDTAGHDISAWQKYTPDN